MLKDIKKVGRGSQKCAEPLQTKNDINYLWLDFLLLPNYFGLQCAGIFSILFYTILLWLYYGCRKFLGLTLLSFSGTLLLGCAR
jgi:hypothetical protein